MLLKQCTKLKYLLEDKNITQICLTECGYPIARVHLKSKIHAVASLLVHVYMPPFKIDEENIEDVVEISHELGCVALALNCKSIIKKFSLQLNHPKFDFENSEFIENENSIKLSVENFITCVNSCERLGFVNLHEFLYKFFVKNFYKISKNTQQLNRLNPNSMRALIFNDELCLESELDLFYALFNWIKFDEENRQKFINEFFNSVCFDKIELSGLIEIENQFSEFIKSSKALSNLFYLAYKYHSMKSSKLLKYREI